MDEYEAEKVAAEAEEREVNPRFPAKVAALKRAREAHKKAMMEVIESDDEAELEEESSFEEVSDE